MRQGKLPKSVAACSSRTKGGYFGAGQCGAAAQPPRDFCAHFTDSSSVISFNWRYIRVIRRQTVRRFALLSSSPSTPTHPCLAFSASDVIPKVKAHASPPTFRVTSKIPPPTAPILSFFSYFWTPLRFSNLASISSSTLLFCCRASGLLPHRISLPHLHTTSHSY